MKKKLHEQSSRYKSLSEDQKENKLVVYKKKRFIIIQGNYFKLGKVYETIYLLSIFKKFSFNKQILYKEV